MRQRRLIVVTALVLVLCLVFAPASGQTIKARFFNLRGAETITAFSYSDELFSGKSTSINPGLAIASVSIAASAHWDDKVTDALKQMGFKDIRLFDYDMSSWSITDNDYVSHSLSRKQVSLGGKSYTLYAIVLSGTRRYDWVSDFKVGTGTEHAGFAAAAQRVMKNIESYVDTPAAENILWITGHSRGAAVSNIVGARLTASQKYAKASRIFCYTSATPATTRKKGLYGSKSYKNLIALNNPGDYITRIPLAAWGYKIYGRTITLPNKGKVFQRMNANMQKLVGYPYAGQTVDTAKKLAQHTQKYARTLKTYANGETYRNAQGTHNPKKYMDGLVRVLIGGPVAEQGLQMMLEEISQSNYAVNLTALMLGLKLPCTRERLISALIHLDPQDPLKSMSGVAFPHTLEAYICWVHALYD